MKGDSSALENPTETQSQCVTKSVFRRTNRQAIRAQKIAVLPVNEDERVDTLGWEAVLHARNARA